MTEEMAKLRRKFDVQDRDFNRERIVAEECKLQLRGGSIITLQPGDIIRTHHRDDTCTHLSVNKAPYSVWTSGLEGVMIESDE